ncbi:hypothetical protein Thiowin_04616 [Thiorhodovibrio winogradskyi]|uniref:Uncharacterized protein n=1 Tax=Thiorhodovibrio winogradskyi TaxID=77007 RepID=A0ABZ0SGL7_9GAMM|nr:hypothetical protein [Thiorhodovibrio winogradskyi]
MEQTLFDDLVQSLKEAKAIARGEMPAAKRTQVHVDESKKTKEVNNYTTAPRLTATPHRCPLE